MVETNYLAVKSSNNAQREKNNEEWCMDLIKLYAENMHKLNKDLLSETKNLYTHLDLINEEKKLVIKIQQEFFKNIATSLDHRDKSQILDLFKKYLTQNRFKTHRVSNELVAVLTFNKACIQALNDETTRLVWGQKFERKVDKLESIENLEMCFFKI
jgi:hypothetical protein